MVMHQICNLVKDVQVVLGAPSSGDMTNEQTIELLEIMHGINVGINGIAIILFIILVAFILILGVAR